MDAFYVDTQEIFPQRRLVRFLSGTENGARQETESERQKEAKRHNRFFSYVSVSNCPRYFASFVFRSPSSCGQSSAFFASLCNIGSKDHTCWMTALTTVSFGEQSQDFEHLWFWSTFETGLDFSSALPGIVDFFSQPFNDFLSLRFISWGHLRRSPSDESRPACHGA